MKFVSLFLCTLSILLLSGCGHNTAMHSKGYGIDISWQQDAFIPNVKVGYWDDSFAMVKENVELKMKSNAGLNANAGNPSTNSETEAKTLDSSFSSNASGIASNEIEIKTGPQINGYVKEVLTNPNLKKETVDAIKAITEKETKEEKK